MNVIVAPDTAASETAVRTSLWESYETPAPSRMSTFPVPSVTVSVNVAVNKPLLLSRLVESSPGISIETSVSPITLLNDEYRTASSFMNSLGIVMAPTFVRSLTSSVAV